MARSIYDIADAELAGEFVDRLAGEVQDESCPPEVRSLGRTMARWRDQIVAWHRARLREELPEADLITKDTLASLLRHDAGGSTGAESAAGLDRRTVNYIHTILHRAFKDAVRWGRLLRNPADAADPPRAGQKSDGVHAWDAPSLRQFLDASRVAEDRHHALWVLLATTGMRRGEAVGLRWSDVDLDAGRARIVQTRNVVSVGEPKTARGRRPISLDPATVAVLRAHRHRMLQERLLVGPDFDDLGLVFHQPDGSWLRPDAVSEILVRPVRRYGLPASR